MGKDKQYVSDDRKFLDAALNEHYKLKNQDAEYLPKEFLHNHVIRDDIKSDPILNPGRIRLERGTGTQLMWSWLMRAKGVTVEQLVNNEVSSQLLQEAADALVQHLKVDKNGPTFDLPEEEQDPKTWCANLSVFGAEKVQEYMANHQRLQNIDEGKAELVLADSKMITCQYFLFNLSQEDKDSWGEEYTGEAIWRLKNPGKQPDPAVDHTAEYIKLYNEKQKHSHAYSGALTGVHDTIRDLTSLL